MYKINYHLVCAYPPALIKWGNDAASQGTSGIGNCPLLCSYTPL